MHQRPLINWENLERKKSNNPNTLATDIEVPFTKAKQADHDRHKAIG